MDTAVQFCLGGCNPLWSASISSCSPNPICQDANLTFSNFNRIQDVSLYDGDASAYDWVINTGKILNTNSSGGDMIMTLDETGGTHLSSTRYMHYGKITARMKTGRWGGVVTAFIMMSDVRDEIDWEWPGDAVTEGQTNYFWQGYVPEGTSNGHVETGLTDTYANFHDYTIDWQLKTLTWSIDGKVVRTLNEADTVDKKGVSHFPNTPSKVELSIWPAGIDGMAAGTVQWGGGMINWNDPDYKAAGHFYAIVRSITIECSDSTERKVGVTAYTYSSNTSSQTPGIKLVNASTLLSAVGNGAETIEGNSYSVRVTMATVVGLVISLLW
ncbi:hypothetical protein H2248_012051 [Termitomyces sp. 'cryptogamus']|nr:hypothetical protein H2248_012051 [Termitomyces sp. 'cryptogamus']